MTEYDKLIHQIIEENHEVEKHSEDEEEQPHSETLIVEESKAEPDEQHDPHNLDARGKCKRC